MEHKIDNDKIGLAFEHELFQNVDLCGNGDTVWRDVRKWIFYIFFFCFEP